MDVWITFDHLIAVSCAVLWITFHTPLTHTQVEATQSNWSQLQQQQQKA